MSRAAFSMGRRVASPSVLAVELDDSWVFWKMGRDGATRISEIPADCGVILRVSSQDSSIAVGRTKGKKLRNKIINEIKLTPSYFIKNSLAFATGVSRAHEESCRVVPVTQIVDHIRRKRKIDAPCVVGFQIGDGSDALCVAFAIRQNLAVDYPAIVTGRSENDMEEAADSALETAGLGQAEAGSVWVDSPELCRLAASTKWTVYPNKNEVFGIPKANLGQAAAAAAFVLLGYSGLEYWTSSRELASVTSEKAKLQTSHKYIGEMRNIVRGHIGRIADMQKIDLGSNILAAKKVRAQNTTVSLTLKRVGISAFRPSGHLSGKLVVQVHSGSPKGSIFLTSNGARVPDKTGLAQMLTRSAPKHWHGQGVTMGANGQIIKVLYARDQ